MECCEQSLRTGELRDAVAIGKAALCLLASLRFNRRSSAASAGYAAVGIRCKQALQAACDAGAELSQKVRQSRTPFWMP